MARRIGAEKVEHWSSADAYGEVAKRDLKTTYRGCWMQFKSSDEGDGPNPNVLRTLVGVWIPRRLESVESDDYFIWSRDPRSWYAVDGDAGFYYDRQGRFRATYVPVRRVGAIEAEDGDGGPLTPIEENDGF